MLLNEKIRQIGRGKYKNAGVGLLKSFEDRLDYFSRNCDESTETDERADGRDCDESAETDERADGGDCNEPAETDERADGRGCDESAESDKRAGQKRTHLM